MSANLYWRPINRGKDLPDSLRYALQKAEWFQERTIVTMASLSYYEGLRDAGIDGAQAVLDAFEKHGDIELFLEY